MTQHYVIDRSSNNALNTNQGDWDAAYSHLEDMGGGGAGSQPAVIWKVGEGTFYLNPNAHPEYPFAVRAGFATAGYGFARLEQDHDPVGEARFWTGHDPDALPINLDWESGGNVGDAVKARGLLGHLLYANQSDMAKVVAAGLPVNERWLAEYDDHPAPSIPCVLWQFTDKYALGGLGVGDCSKWLGDERGWSDNFTNTHVGAEVATTPPGLETPAVFSMNYFDPIDGSLAFVDETGALATFNNDGSPGGHFNGNLIDHPQFGAGAGKPEGPVVGITPWLDHGTLIDRNGGVGHCGYVIWTQSADRVLHRFNFGSVK